MSEFCENVCSMRGGVEGPIDDILCGVAEMWQRPLRRATSRDVVIGFAIDGDRNFSEPFRVPGVSIDDGVERIEKRLDACQGPGTTEKGIFRKREVFNACPAIGMLALSPERRDKIVRQLRGNLI